MRGPAIAAIALLVSVIHFPVAAAVVTINRTVGPADIAAFHTQLDDTRPTPGSTYVDEVSAPIGPVTVAGGDTVDYRLSLTAPYRFKVSPQVADVSYQEIGQLYANLSLYNTYEGPTPQQQSFAGGPVSLLGPDNIASPSSNGMGLYELDTGAGRVTRLQQFQYSAGTQFLSDTSRAGFFTGFAGSFVVPDSAPTTTFADNSGFFIDVFVRAGETPSPLIEVVAVPEPVMFCPIGIALIAVATFTRGSRARFECLNTSRNAR